MSPMSLDRDHDGLTRRRFLEGSALVPIVFVVVWESVPAFNTEKVCAGSAVVVPNGA